MRRWPWILFTFACSAAPSDPVPYVERPLSGAHVSDPRPPDELAVTRRAHELCALIDRARDAAGILGTDLGVSVQWQGQLAFLFGDTTPDASLVRPPGSDAFATVDSHMPAEGACSRLRFAAAPDGGFDPITLDGHTLPFFNVATGAFPGHHHLFAFFTVTDDQGRTIGTRGGRGVLGRSDGGPHFETVRFVSPTNDRFNMIAATLAPPDLPGVPDDWRGHEAVLLYGTGQYRRSFPRLALMQRDHVEVPWIYFAGLDATGVPMWSRAEESAMPLFPDKASDACVGEMSVAFAPHVARWLMAYNCRGRILVRSAREPWGAWSVPVTIFDKKTDGWGVIMHHPCGVDAQRCDTSDYSPGLGPDVSGDAYGPYFVPDWFSSPALGEENVVFSMSTWNPYASLLMEGTVRVPVAEASAPLAP